MKSNYDLTTKDGFVEAIEFFEKYSWIIFPVGWLLKKGLSPEISTEKQIEAARTLIIEGKKQGVKKMQIKVSHKVGGKLGSEVDGNPIKLEIGHSGDTVVIVEYK